MVDVGVPYNRLYKKTKGVVEHDYISDVKIIFVTHIHKDHLNPSTVRQIGKKNPNIIFAVGEYLVDELKELGIKKIITLEKVNDTGYQYKKYDFGICTVIPFHLYHDVPNVGFIITIDGINIFYATDTVNLDGITAKGMDWYFVEHHHVQEHYDEVIAMKKAKGVFSHEIGAQYSHMSFEYVEGWLKNNVIKFANVVRLHMSSDKYYKDIALRYIYMEGVGAVEMDDFLP